MTESGADRRSSPRVPVDFLVELRMPTGGVTLRAHNLSEEGVFVATDDPLPVGTRVRFVMRFGGAYGEAAGQAEVRWLGYHIPEQGIEDLGVPAVRIRGMGIQITEMDFSHRLQLKIFVATRLGPVKR